MDRGEWWQLVSEADSGSNQDFSDALFGIDTQAINVKAKPFFAKGDGVTDDTAAIHNARDSGASELWFADGTYLVTGLGANVADQTWRLSKGATIKLADSSDSPVIEITADGVSVSGGVVDGNKANQTTGAGILATGADNCRVEDVHVKDTKTRGIHFQNCAGPVIRGNRVTASDNIGIFVEVTSGASEENAIIVENTVDRSSLATTLSEGGLKVHGDNSSLAFSRAKIAQNHVALPSGATTVSAICIEVWGLSPYSAVVGNTTAGGYMSISVSSSDYCTVTGNTSFDANQNGIEIADSDRCSVTANTIDGNADTVNGIHVSSAASNYNTLSGNTIHDVTGSGIKVNTSDYTSITGNMIDVTALQAIEMISSQYITICGNILQGNGTCPKAVFLDKSDRAAISGNAVNDFTTAGVQIFGNAAVTLDRVALAGNTFENTPGVFSTSLSGGAAIGENCTAHGNAGLRFGAGIPTDIVDLLNNVLIARDSGSPESALTGGVGSIYQRRDGGAGTSFYVKESGTGNTGWVAK